MARAESELATADAELVVQQTEASAYLLAQQTVPYQDRVFLYQASMIVAGRTPASVPPEPLTLLRHAARMCLPAVVPGRVSIAPVVVVLPVPGRWARSHEILTTISTT